MRLTDKIQSLINYNKPQKIDISTSIAPLMAVGLEIEPLGTAQIKTDYPVSGIAFSVNGDLMKVYEFSTEREADRELKIIEKAYTNTTLIDDNKAPHKMHLYKKGRDIIEYIGNSRLILHIMDLIFGPQKAFI